MRSSRPTAAEQGEERKVWGSRSCHTQMTDCGGLFSSSFSRNPDALPPPIPSSAAFPLFPAFGTAGDDGQHNSTPPTPIPPHTRRPQSLLMDHWTNPLQAKSSPSFLATGRSPRFAWRKRRALPLPEGWAPQKRAHATEQLSLLVLLPKDGFLWLRRKVFR